MKKIVNFTKVHFIKLGISGCWENECIKTNILKIGFNEANHEDCLNGKWGEVYNQYLKNVKNKRVATFYTNQIKKFYEFNSETLWMTFHNRMLYWCFADKKIEIDLKNNKIKNVQGRWNNSDINGNKLSLDFLSTTLTQVQAFRGAICDIGGDRFNYLKRKINGEILPEVSATIKNLSELKKSLEKLISDLTWQDFELLTDLIFTFGGWKRIETLGKTQKSIDLDLIYPIEEKRAFVQVKSKADFQTFQEYYAEFKNMPQYNKMFFIVHDTIGKLNDFKSEDENVEIIKIDKLTDLAVNAGLTDWVIKKSK